jgi:(R,R)-butanediol dehydrogenase/meso-butanediol dehydrogenase/diacetyl reductase
LKALVWSGQTEIEVQAVDAPSSSQDWVLVRPEYVGVCGTDLTIVSGAHLRAKPGIVIGHEIVGRTIGASRLPEGTLVFVNPLLDCGACRPCRSGAGHACERLRLLGVDLPGGAAEQVSVPARSIVEIPSHLTALQAALTEPLSVAVRAVRQSHLQVGDYLHVVGAGPIGLLCALVGRAAGAGRVTIAEVAPMRRELAAAAQLEVVDGVTDHAADAVIDATGHPAGARSLLQAVRYGGTAVMVGMHAGLAEVDLRQLIFGENTLRGSRNYTSKDVAAALALLATGQIDYRSIVTAVVTLAEAPEAVRRLRQGTEGKVLISISPPAPASTTDEDSASRKAGPIS